MRVKKDLSSQKAIFKTLYDKWGDMLHIKNTAKDINVTCKRLKVWIMQFKKEKE